LERDYLLAEKEEKMNLLDSGGMVITLIKTYLVNFIYPDLFTNLVIKCNIHILAA
jgi:hypothetical protein